MNLSSKEKFFLISNKDKIPEEEGEFYMSDKVIENNQVSIMGKIDTPFQFSHQVFGEGFYMTDLLVKRLSDYEDRNTLMV